MKELTHLFKHNAQVRLNYRPYTHVCLLTVAFIKGSFPNNEFVYQSLSQIFYPLL